MKMSIYACSGKKDLLTSQVLKCQRKFPTDCVGEKYFLPSEVVVHNSPEDCWVSYLGGVYDISEVCREWAGRKEIKPILAHAGKDISHWFDHDRNNIRHYVHPITGILVPYCPHGTIPDVSPYATIPTNEWRPLDKCPWWLDEKYKKGYLTKNPRPCKILNVLTGTAATIMVCEEDTIRRIRERYSFINPRASSYLWKYERKELDLEKTLTENQIFDKRERFAVCHLSDDFYVPCLMCYYVEPK